MVVPIDDHPNEILVKIFVLYGPPRRSDIEAFGPGTKLERRDACRWAPLMGVWRNWRTVALETPLLCQVVDVGESTKWLELALVRTRDAVLELYLHAHPTSVETLPMLLPHMHRVRKLLFPLMSIDLSFLSVIQLEAFPVLDELRLWVNTPEAQIPVEYVPCDLSPIHSPTLRVLHLQNAVVPWTATD